MNRKLWVSLYVQLFKPIFKVEQCFIEVNLLSQQKYPALSRLQHLSSIELLLLSYFIHDLENTYWTALELYSFNHITDQFDNYDCTHHQISQALVKLYNLKLISIHVDVEGTLAYKANKTELVKQKIYVPNWDIHALGLKNICKN